MSSDVLGPPETDLSRAGRIRTSGDIAAAVDVPLGPSTPRITGTHPLVAAGVGALSRRLRPQRAG
ncbi:hypothetical protein [Streptomyces sp. NPDC056061]|uniref:hypothetical protein n=1 Tax=Streptomyces sp. NPDC056061 TaxID=3345700 RepID=UPI0035DB3B32